jgi:hypothetical protein
MGILLKLGSRQVCLFVYLEIGAAVAVIRPLFLLFIKSEL